MADFRNVLMFNFLKFTADNDIGLNQQRKYYTVATFSFDQINTELSIPITRSRAKSNVCPPGCATSRRRPATHIQKLVATATSHCRIEKLILRLIIYSHGYTNPKNLAKIGQIDFEIIGLTEIVKINK